jgi:DNA-binding MarR family transcriptional regulator
MTPPALSARIAAGLSKLSLVLRHHGWQAAGRRALTPTQAQILALLASRAGAGLRLAEIAAQLAVTPPTASDAVAALEAKGLVKKQPDPADSRAAQIRLTPRGRRAAEAVSQWPDYLLAAVDALPAPIQEHLLAALMAMIRSLQEQGRIPVARMCTNCRFFEPDRFPGTAAPHYCGFVQAPFGVRDFRVDCPDFEPAAGEAQRANQRVLIPHSNPEGGSHDTTSDCRL